MTIGRPKEFDTEQAMTAAMHLFWRKGYESTSLQDLLDTMNLSKSSLYQTYGSKNELFQQCINHYRNTMVSEMNQGLKDATNGRQFIETVFNSVPDETCQKNGGIGCLIMNSANEFANADKEISVLITKGTKEFTNVFITAIKQAQQQGDISKNKDPKSLAYFLLSSLSGLKTMVKAGASRATVEDIVKTILASLD